MTASRPGGVGRLDGFARFVDGQSLQFLAVALFIALLFAREFGGWVRRRVAGRQDDPADDVSDKSYVISGVLGLLALLVAFTFSLAMSRYEERRTVVVDEANAIGTAQMRVQLLAAPHDAQLLDMLRGYARVRLAYGRATAAEKIPLVATSEQRRGALEAATIAALRPIAETPLAAFVGASVNSVLDVGGERDALNAARLPGTILAALIFYNLLTAAVLGYVLTGARARQRPATLILFALLTLSILLILDLDRPQRGTILIDQTPMVKLVASFPSVPAAR